MDVLPLRWNARGFVRAGVVFAVTGANVTVSGPVGRDDLQQALAAEIARRVDAFARFAPARGPFPRVSMPGAEVQRSGACDACGDALDRGRGGMCPLCTVALQKVLRSLGRI